MSAVAAIGEEERVVGYALAGAIALPAGDPNEARAAWEALPRDTGLVLLTPSAHAALHELLDERPLLWVVLPE